MNKYYTITQLHRQLQDVFMKFSDIKSETLNLRVSPTFKQTLKKAAENEQRSMVNMLEFLLADYCVRKGEELYNPDFFQTIQQLPHIDKQDCAGDK